MERVKGSKITQKQIHELKMAFIHCPGTEKMEIVEIEETSLPVFHALEVHKFTLKLSQTYLFHVLLIKHFYILLVYVISILGY